MPEKDNSGNPSIQASSDPRAELTTEQTGRSGGREGSPETSAPNEVSKRTAQANKMDQRHALRTWREEQDERNRIERFLEEDEVSEVQ